MQEAFLGYRHQICCPPAGGLWGVSALVHPASWLVLHTGLLVELVVRWLRCGC